MNKEETAFKKMLEMLEQGHSLRDVFYEMGNNGQFKDFKKNYKYVQKEFVRRQKRVKNNEKSSNK